MSVYRGDKPKDKNPAQKPESQNQPPVRQPDSELIGLNQHRQRHGHDPLDNSDEAPEGGLVEEPASTTAPTPEPNYFKPPSGSQAPSRQGFFNNTTASIGGSGHDLGAGLAKAAKSSAGKKAALALSGILGPAVVGVVLLMLAFKAGFQTEHIARVITGVRFSSLYGQMTKRLDHIKESHTLCVMEPGCSPDEIDDLKNHNNRRPNRRPSLVARLTGTSDKKIYRDLVSKGYSLEYEDRLVPGRSRAIGIVDSKGRRVLDFQKGNPDPRSITRQLKDFEVELRGQPGFGDGLWGRFKARRVTRLVAYQAGFKFKRFRGAMDNIRRARVWATSNRARAPPADLKTTSHAISDDIVTQKGRVRRNVIGFNGLGPRGVFFHVSEKDIDEAARGWAYETQKGWAKRKRAGKVRNWVDEKGKRLEKTRLVEKLKSKGLLGKIRGFARGASALFMVATVFCAVNELIKMVRQVAEIKIAQNMDAAAGLFTLASQMRAGDMEHALSNNLSGRLDGYANTATYQILHDGSTSPTKSHVENTIGYINDNFNIKKYFGAAFKVMDGFISWSKRILEYALLVVSPGFLAAELGNYFLPGKPLPTARSLINLITNKVACPGLLNPAIALPLGLSLAAVEFILGVLTGGLFTAITTSVGVFLRMIVFSIAIQAALKSTDFEEAVINHVAPELYAVATGIDSALAENPNPEDIDNYLPEDRSGPENYLRVDYGAWHLSQAQALAEGGGLIDRNTAIAQDKFYIAQYKDSYTQQGIWNNIANADNPYSTISRLASWLPSNPFNSQPNQIRSAASWLAQKPAGLVSTAQAEEEIDEIIGYLLYPDQGREIEAIEKQINGAAAWSDYTTKTSKTEGDPVVGFTEAEASGIGKFSFFENSLYVEKNFDDLKRNYSECLVIELPKFRLHQAGIKDEKGNDYYPMKCTTDEPARRYMIYYQDCLHLNDIERAGTESSPMFASDCDDLLPGDPDDPESFESKLKEADSELESVSGIDDISQGIQQMVEHTAADTDQIRITEPASSVGQPVTSPIVVLGPKTPAGARLWMAV